MEEGHISRNKIRGKQVEILMISLKEAGIE